MKELYIEAALSCCSLKPKTAIIEAALSCCSLKHERVINSEHRDNRIKVSKSSTVLSNVYTCVSCVVQVPGDIMPQ